MNNERNVVRLVPPEMLSGIIIETMPEILSAPDKSIEMREKTPDKVTQLAL